MIEAARAQIAYLETLRKHGILDQAMMGTLPDQVVKAARVVAKSAFPSLPFDKEKSTIPVTAEEQSEIDREIEEYLIHYGLAKRRELAADQVILFPRLITRGKKYEIVLGTYQWKEALIQGTDKDMFGCTWLDNFGHPACEAYPFRIQKDKLPLVGNVYVGIIDGQDILFHESEIGNEVK